MVFCRFGAFHIYRHPRGHEDCGGLRHSVESVPLLFSFTDDIKRSDNTKERQQSVDNSRLIFTVSLHDSKLGVWCALSVTRIIWPISFSTTINSGKYSWRRRCIQLLQPIIQWPPYRTFFGTELLFRRLCGLLFLPSRLHVTISCGDVSNDNISYKTHERTGEYFRAVRWHAYRKFLDKNSKEFLLHVIFCQVFSML